MSISFAKTEVSEDVKSGGWISVGEGTFQNKELECEPKDDADFAALLTPEALCVPNLNFKGRVFRLSIPEIRRSGFHPFKGPGCII
jgi:hypothetical protein